MCDGLGGDGCSSNLGCLDFLELLTGFSNRFSAGGDFIGNLSSRFSPLGGSLQVNDSLLPFLKFAAYCVTSVAHFIKSCFGFFCLCSSVANVVTQVDCLVVARVHFCALETSFALLRRTLKLASNCRRPALLIGRFFLLLTLFFFTFRRLTLLAQPLGFGQIIKRLLELAVVLVKL